jgi:hypothetical protein
VQVPVSTTRTQARQVTETTTRTVPVQVPFQVPVASLTTQPRQFTEQTTRTVPVSVPVQVPVTVMTTVPRQVSRQVPVVRYVYPSSQAPSPQAEPSPQATGQAASPQETPGE